MIALNYVRRCKKKTGDARHKTVHVADNNATYCGKEVDEMWYVEAHAGFEPKDVTCRVCKRIMRAAARQEIEGTRRTI